MRNRMKYKSTLFTALLFILTWLFLGFQYNDSYISEINEWHSKRIKSLEKNTSWLTLAGLYWLDEGENKFGSDESNEIVFPEGTPLQMGTIFLNDTSVYISVLDDVSVKNDSLEVKKMQLRNDNQHSTTMLSHESLEWYILKRSDKYGIRLKDREHPNLKNFKGVDRYPVDISWRIKAKLEKYESQKALKITNVLGQTTDSPCPGALVFKVNGKEYRVDPIGDDKSDKYWILFGDATNGDETYGAGRYLYVDAVDENGETFIDFNMSYNPPCVFSPYATCPLPPEQNVLDIKILAGEKNWENEPLK